MKKINIKLLALLLALCLVLLPLAVALGDAGNFGGGDDFGGGGDYGGSWGGGDYGGGTSGGGGPLSWGGMVGVIIIIIIGSIISEKHKKKGKVAPGMGGTPQTGSQTLRPIAELQAKDPAFSAEDLQRQFANLYVRMQNAWTAKDFEPMRPYFSDGLYAQFNNQLSEYVRDGKTNYVSNIAVLSVYVLGWQAQGENDIIVSRVKVRVNDYVTDDKSGALLQGSKTASVFMEYEWVLSRDAKAKTEETMGATRHVSCPSCGAPLSLNESAKCPYCGTLVTVANKGWVLSGIRGISKQTGA